MQTLLNFLVFIFSIIIVDGVKMTTKYLGIQFRLPCTPSTIFHGCLIVNWDPLNAKRRCSQKTSYGLCENAWFPWKPIADLRMGVCLQKYLYLSCYLSLTTKLNTKLSLDICLLSPCCICKLFNLHIHKYL